MSAESLHTQYENLLATHGNNPQKLREEIGKARAATTVDNGKMWNGQERDQEQKNRNRDYRTALTLLKKDGVDTSAIRNLRDLYNGENDHLHAAVQEKLALLHRTIATPSRPSPAPAAPPPAPTAGPRPFPTTALGSVLRDVQSASTPAIQNALRGKGPSDITLVPTPGSLTGEVDIQVDGVAITITSPMPLTDADKPAIYNALLKKYH